jgi:hypothetical protein
LLVKCACISHHHHHHHHRHHHHHHLMSIPGYRNLFWLSSSIVFRSYFESESGCAWMCVCVRVFAGVGQLRSPAVQLEAQRVRHHLCRLVPLGRLLCGRLLQRALALRPHRCMCHSSSHSSPCPPTV